jgi:hypothetical protein
MSPWVSLVLDACMAALMAALIVYCVKLNRRLALLRDQGNEIRELVAGLRDASERAELSVQRLKAAGLAAERSLRAAIEDAARTPTAFAGRPAAAATPPPPERMDGKPRASAARAETSAAARSTREKRDMLLAAATSADGQVPAPAAQVRPRTREEAEDSVIQAIRSARGDA